MSYITNKAGITLDGGFKLDSAQPLDVRFVVASGENKNDLLASSCYAGMEVWDSNDNKKYRAIPKTGGGFEWKEIGTVEDIPEINLDGYVKGPSSATDTAIALYDGTTGKKIKNSGATIDANRNLKFNGPGNISWEDGSYFQRIQITDDSAQNTAVFTFQQTEDTGKTWSNLFTIQDRGTIVAKNSTGGALSLTLDRGSNANWRWLSDNGNFIAQCDYTSSKGSYFNVLTMAYNTGNVSVDKGTLTSKGGFIHGNLTVPTGKSKNDYVLLAGGGSKILSDLGVVNITDLRSV